MKIVPNEKFETGIEYETENPVQNVINTFENYPNIKMIISKIKTNKIFFFCPVSENETLNQIKNLDNKKGIAKRYPNKIVKTKFLFLLNFFLKTSASA